MKSSKDYESAALLDTGIIAVIGGVFANSIYAGFAPYCFAISAAGVISIVYYARSWCKLDKLFMNLKIGVGSSYPIFKYKQDTENGEIYRFTVPCGLSLNDVTKHQEAISLHLGCPVNIRNEYKELIIETITKDTNFKPLYEPVSVKGNMPILIGYDKKKTLISCDMASGEPHMLIAGETGSGKSTALRAIITNLILKSKATIHLIDLKNGVEFSIFAKSSRITTFVRSVEEARDFLKTISSEIDRRYNLFFEYDVIDIKEYNSKFKPLDYQVIVIDEFADLQDDKIATKLLETVSAKARACGIHLVISTQRPDHKVINGRIKANVPTILGLKTSNDINSRIIIDESGLERLKGNGQGIFKHSSFNLKEIQVPYLAPDVCRELIRHTYVEKDLNKGICKKDNKKLNKKDKIEQPKVLDFDALREVFK